MAPQDEETDAARGAQARHGGRGRWAAKGQLKEAEQAVPQPFNKYYIVGTWADWDPSEMIWRQEAACYECKVTLGEGGTENFKILLEDDWNRCIYPSCKNASPHTPHEIRGPDDGGVDEDWTIGLHPADEAVVGATYLVKLHVTLAGRPNHVSWEKLSENGKDANGELAPSKVKPKWSKGPDAPVAPEKRDAPLLRAMADDITEREPQKQQGGQHWDPFDDRDGRSVVEFERAARERLARRLEAEAQLVAIRDEDDGAAEGLQVTLAREQQEREHQIEANKQRYLRSVEEDVTVRASKAQSRSREPARCMECGKVTTNMVSLQPCCENCLKAWEELREEGWDGNVLCGGLPASRRALQVCMDNANLNPMGARRHVMKMYSYSFRREVL